MYPRPLLFEKAPYPSTLPAYDAMVVDWQDHLWVRSYPTGGQPTITWVVFDTGGG